MVDYVWEKYKTILNKVFFRDNDVIKRGTSDYNNFWQFLAKYTPYEKQKKKSTCDEKNISNNYDKQNRINFCLNFTDTDELMSRLPPVDDERGGLKLTRHQIEEFRLTVLHYLDFLQKRKLNKLVKLRKSQETLPMFNFTTTNYRCCQKITSS